MAKIVLEKVCKVFKGGVKAVSDFSMEIRRRRIHRLRRAFRVRKIDDAFA